MKVASCASLALASTLASGQVGSWNRVDDKLLTCTGNEYNGNLGKMSTAQDCLTAVVAVAPQHRPHRIALLGPRRRLERACRAAAHWPQSRCRTAAAATSAPTATPPLLAAALRRCCVR